MAVVGRKFDDILGEIGELGPYQVRVYLVVLAPVAMIASEAMAGIFTFNIPDHRCAIPGVADDSFHPHNDTHAALVRAHIPTKDGAWDQCHVMRGTNVSDVTADNGTLERCSGWVFDHSVFQSTVATDFEVVCERKIQRAQSYMVTEIGSALTTLLSGPFSDRFGRKLMMCPGGVALVTGGFGIAFVTDIVTFNVCRFCFGMARMVIWVNSFVIGLEIVGPSKRVLAGLVAEVIWGMGCLLLLPMAFFIRHWRYLEIAASIPSVFLLFYWWLIPESPRWLIIQGRQKEAIAILSKIAASNRRPLLDLDPAQLVDVDPGANFLQVFRSRELVLRLVIVFSNMFVVVLVYYAITLNVTNLSGDIFVNYGASVGLELAAYVVNMLALRWLGRKTIYCSTVIAAGLVCLGSVLPVLMDAPVWTVTALSMVGRFLACIAFATLYLYASELFPTTIRTSTLSVGVAFSRLANIVSPYIADVGILVGGRLRHALPLLVMGVPTVVIGLLSLWLPETMATKLPELVTDVTATRHRCTKTEGLCCSASRHRKDKRKTSLEPCDPEESVQLHAV